MRRIFKGLGYWLAAVVVVLAIYLVPGMVPPRTPIPPSAKIPPFRHVFVIMMENQSAQLLLNNPQATYIRHLAQTYGYDRNYYGVTHPSLPNYVALLSGLTHASHSDNPTQVFTQPTLVTQLDAHHLSWQGVMGGLPFAGYTGNWWAPAGSAQNPMAAPPTALYAKKHDPFMLFPAIVRRHADQVVPLTTLAHELASGHVPRFVWITPNLCQDMHGQPNTPQASCPANHRNQLVRDGNQFLHQWVPMIQHSTAFRGNSVIFITWDEASDPSGLPTPGRFWQFRAAGPGAPPITPSLAWMGPLGGGQVPLIVIAHQYRHRVVTSLWADHYSILKTIESAWHLGYLGHARNAQVPVLWPFFTHSKHP